MSGPVGTSEAPPTVAWVGTAEPAEVEVSDSRSATVGRFEVRRALPRRHRRTVGAWCFTDLFGPAEVTEEHGLDIGPHPHIGLQTVTWLLAGEVLHRDSLGSEQLIRPGQLNLMTAGRGVVHSEEATGSYRGELHGVQLWVAQPELTRDGEAAFEHHSELPVARVDGTVATVLIGEFAGERSPARHDTELVGVDAAVSQGATAWPLRPTYEHALLVLEGELELGGHHLERGQLGYLGRDRDQLEIVTQETARVLLLGGEPFPEPVLMWWNFVARTRAEMNVAFEQWQSGDARFGTVASRLPRIPAPRPSWLA